MTENTPETIPVPTPANGNDFISVLWRRMQPDIRLHRGWTWEECERNFRKTVERTMADCLKK
jgi:hypothetical protein